MKKEQQLDLYYQMVLIRRAEERGAELYQQGKIGGVVAQRVDGADWFDRGARTS